MKLSEKLTEVEEKTQYIEGIGSSEVAWLIARVKKLTEALEQIKKNKWVDGNLEITGSEYTLMAIAAQALDEE